LITQRVQLALSLLLIVGTILGGGSCSRSPVTPTPPQGVQDLNPRWRKGTSLVAFYRHVPPDSDAALSGLYVVDTLNGAARQVLSGYITSFDWIPNTDTLVITNGLDVSLLSTTSGQLIYLLQHPSYNIEVSPSGDRIVFDGDRSGRNTIFLYDRSRQSITAPLTDTVVAKYASWTHSETTLVAVIGTTSTTGIRLFHDDGRLDSIVYTRPASARYVSCSPIDDNVGWAERDGDGRMRIAVFNPHGSIHTLLYVGSSGPSWASDGYHFVFSAPTAGGDRLFIGDIGGSPPHLVMP